MTKPSLHEFVDARISAGTVTENDILVLRSFIYIDMSVSLAEAEALFRLNRADCTFHGDWYDLFPEAVADLLVHQARPERYVTDDHAAWLIDQITTDGKICARTELDALLHVLEKARQSPTFLGLFALKAVAESVVTGTGCTRAGNTLTPGVISDGEVELLRRVLYAGSGSGGTAISREEAEILFDLNDATAEAENAAAWSELFTKAVANHLMALSGFTPPSREVALARENWEKAPGGFDGGVAGFFRTMFGGGVRGIRDAYEDRPDPFAERGAAMTEEIGVNEVVDSGEAGWLVERIGRDGRLHENEKALLRFIRNESPDIHPALTPLMAKVA